MTFTEALYQLESIKEYTWDQIDPDDPFDVWSKDIEALNMAMVGLCYLKYKLEVNDENL